MEYIIKHLTLDKAMEFTKWKYDGEYAIYNYPAWKYMLEKNYSITNERKRNEEYRGIFEKNDLIAVFRFFYLRDEIFVGLGLKPQLCGKGLGSEIMGIILNYAIENSLKTLNLKVRNFNKRELNAI